MIREDFVPFGVSQGVSKIPSYNKMAAPITAFSTRFGLTEKKLEKKFSIIAMVITLFVISSIFGTLAWYYNIDRKYAFLAGFAVSMLLVVCEYLFLIPANSIGYTIFSIFQLSLMVELINWTVFILYIKYVRGEEITNKGWLSLLIIGVGVVIGYM